MYMGLSRSISPVIYVDGTFIVDAIWPDEKSSGTGEEVYPLWNGQ